MDVVAIVLDVRTNLKLDILPKVNETLVHPKLNNVHLLINRVVHIYNELDELVTIELHFY